MATNASRTFLVKLSDKGNVACGVSKLKAYIIYIITSFKNSETIALLHLTSFTEDVSITNKDFHMPIAFI